MHHALEYVQGKLNISEQSALFEHVLTCSACQDDLIIYLRLNPAPVFTIPKPDNYVVQSLNLARRALTLGLRLIPLGDTNE